MAEAKEKLSRADSSSDESDEEGVQKRKKIEMGEKPTEEMVEKLEERLEAANVDQKRLFLIVFQRFIMILSEHLLRCDTDGQDYDNDWYRWTIGRLQQVFLVVRIKDLTNNLAKRISYLPFSLFLQHHEQVQKYSSTLETLLFTSELDSHTLDVFQQFVALRA